MSFNVNDSGTWRPLSIWVNDSATWRKLAIWVNDAGTWRQLTATDTLLVPQVTLSASSTAPTDATCNLRFDTDGHERGGNNAFTDFGAFISPTASTANYSVRATTTSGAFTSGTTGSYLALTSNRLWTVVFTGNNGSASCTATFDFARTADTSTIVYSVSITMDASVSP